MISLASSLYLSVAAYLHVAIFLDTDPYTSASVLSKFRQIAPHSDLIGNQVLLLLFSHHILLLIDIIMYCLEELKLNSKFLLPHRLN